MKKNKLIKSIVGAIMCSAMALGAVAMSACHEHEWKYGSDEAAHWQYCTKCDEKGAREGHTDGDADGKCDVCEKTLAKDVNDTVAVAEVKLNKTSLTLVKGGSETLTATVSPDNATDKTVTWSSSDDSIATVDTSGKVTALKAGSVTVTARAGEKSATCVVTINPAVIAVEGVSLDKSSLEVEMGKSSQLTATVTPADATDNTVVWSSSDESIATVDASGKVTGVKAGNATITAAAGGKSATCAVEVTIPTKLAVFELIPTNLEAQKYNNGLKSGIYTILSGTTVRTRSRENKKVVDYETNETVEELFTAHKSVQYNATDVGISIAAPAAGKLTIYVDNGSSGLAAGAKQTILLTNPDGSTQTLSYPASGLYAISLDLPAAGTYKITRGSGGTTDLYYAKFEATVPVTPVEEIQIAAKGKVEYLLGQEFDPSGLQVQLIYSVTHMVEPVDYDDSHLEIDDKAYDSGKEGKYTIKLTYTDDDGNKFTAQYEVSVFGVEALELGFNKIVTGTSGYNGTYENISVKQFYYIGDTLKTDGLTVRTVYNGGADKVIVTSGYTVEPVDMSTAGKKTVVVKWNDNVQASYEIYVAAKPVEVGETVMTYVSADVTDAQVGVANASGAYQFKTIKQTLDFLEGLELEENVNKLINLAEGTYTEKVEINIPNLTIRGGTDAEKTVIEWDALYNELDESGFAHVTDSTATLNVRRGATGFVIEGVTISNKFNSEEYFNQIKGPNYKEHRALAMLVQADKVVIDNCRLLGYQDTLELFTGRQVVQNSYIQGRTDFIFGTNNTTYFYNCEIRSIVSTGYVTAFKGNNKGSQDAVLYGAIFDHCNFTAPASVVGAKDTAIARPWGEYAAVAVINSTLDGHISVKGSTGVGAGERYVAMSENLPTASTVKFVEYNNTGAGAITEQVAGMTMLDSATAANYSDYSVIFGKTNGGVTYTTAWDGQKGVIITEKEYKFTADAVTESSLHATEEEGESIFGGAVVVYALNGAKWRAESSKSQAQFNAGCVIKVKVAGEVYVTFTTHGATYGIAENIQINYVNGFATIKIVATEASPLTQGCYLANITLDSSKTPQHIHVYGDWSVSETPTETAGGTAVRECLECELETAASQSVTLPALSLDSYTVAASANEGKSIYTYTDETYGTVTFEADALSSVHVHNYGDWVITATSEEAGTATKTCTGTVGECDEPTISVNIPALTDSAYTITNNTATLEAEGEGDYAITVDGVEVAFHAATSKKVIKVIDSPATISFGESGNYNNYLNNVSLYAVNSSSAAIRDNGGNNSQINNGTVLTMKVKAGATVTVSSYSGYTNYTVKINGADYNEGTAETGTSWTYKADNDSTIEFVSGSNNYFYSISVSYGLVEITGNREFKSTDGVESTSEIEFTGVQSHNNGEYWNLGKTGTIKIKVEAGATITLTCGYWGEGITINGVEQTCTNGTPIEYTAANGGEVVIGCKENAANVSYVQTISVS